jgi:uncharacterized protein
VALFSKNDARHEVCAEELRNIPPPLLTSWPVLTEVAWLLRHYPPAFRQLLGSVERNFLRILDLDSRFLRWGAGFLETYESIGAQLADASLVYLAEREKIGTVFTLDRRDFAVYRTTGNRTLGIVPER